MSRTPKTPRASLRVAPAFHLLRQFVVHFMAHDGVPTLEIAEKLGHVRSFVIKQTHIVLKPRNALERRILKLAGEHAAALKRRGFTGLLGAVDIETTLAGGERPKLGPLDERRAKRAKKTPAPKSTPKSAPKAKKSPAPKADAKGAEDKARDAAREKKKRERDRARRARLKAGNLTAPLPAERLAPEPQPAAGFHLGLPSPDESV
jgi:hypothetical protein